MDKSVLPCGEKKQSREDTPRERSSTCRPIEERQRPASEEERSTLARAFAFFLLHCSLYTRLLSPWASLYIVSSCSARVKLLGRTHRADQGLAQLSSLPELPATASTRLGLLHYIIRSVPHTFSPCLPAQPLTTAIEQQLSLTSRRDSHRDGRRRIRPRFPRGGSGRFGLLTYTDSHLSHCPSRSFGQSSPLAARLVAFERVGLPRCDVRHSSQGQWQLSEPSHGFYTTYHAHSQAAQQRRKQWR